MEGETLVRPCLVCNRPTLVRRQDWVGEAPAAFCIYCCKKITAGAIAWEIVRMLFMIRCSLQQLHSENELRRIDINRLFNAQQDVEADLTRIGQGQ